jgi:hypothetical protein
MARSLAAPVHAGTTARAWDRHTEQPETLPTHLVLEVCPRGYHRDDYIALYP